MKTAIWKLHEAKDRLSEVVERARRQGEQTITEHGKPKLGRGTGASLIALMQSCPAPEIFDIMEKERLKDRARGLRDLAFV
jgi:antitoxin (DNA-binding transcriptional repressor) of toxin-antitoxin stability system